MRNSVPYATPSVETQVRVNAFVRGVYNWMAIGLGLTAVTAFFVANNPTVLQLIFGNPLVFFGLIIAELALVFSISARVHRMRAGTATNLFMLYAILKGWEPQKWVQFGWATGAMTTTMLTDYAQPADEEQVWSIWQGNARVRR